MTFTACYSYSIFTWTTLTLRHLRTKSEINAANSGAMTNLSLKTSVCTPLRRLLLIKLLLLTTSLMGQLQAIVKSDWSLSHNVSKETSISDNVIQGTVLSALDPRTNPANRIAVWTWQRSDRDHMIANHVYYEVLCESSGVWPSVGGSSERSVFSRRRTVN